MIAPNWSGENARFDVTADSAKDLHLLPALKKVSAIYDLAKRAAAVEAFAA